MTGDCQPLSRTAKSIRNSRRSASSFGTVGIKHEENTTPRKLYFCGGAEESKGGDGGAAAASPHAVAPVGAPSVHSCGGAEERKRCDGDAVTSFAHAVAPVGAPGAAAVGLYGEGRSYNKSGCRAEQRRFRKNLVTRRDSLARRATIDNRRLAAKQGSQMAWSVTIGVIY
jgi:hypothetical protein